MGLLHGTRRALLGGAARIRYLLRDEFTTDRAAGAVDGTAAEPGPGTRVVNDSGNNLAISSGLLEMTDHVSAGDPGYWLDGVARVAGRLVIARMRDVTEGQWTLGADIDQSGALGGSAYIYLYLKNFRAPAVFVGPFSQNVWYQVIIVYRTAGCYYLVKGGSEYANWTFLWFHASGADGTLHPAMTTSSGPETYQLDYIRVPDVLWLPTPIAYDSFTRANGALGTSETTGPDGQAVTGRTWALGSATWVVSGNKAANMTTRSNLLENPEFTTDLSGWAGPPATRRDYTSSPDIDPTGGDDDFGVELENQGVDYQIFSQEETLTVGKLYMFRCRAYAPSTNTFVRAASIRCYYGSTTYMRVTAENVWQTLCLIQRATAALGTLGFTCRGTTAGDLAHFDKGEVAEIDENTLFSSVDDAQTSDVGISVDVSLPTGGHFEVHAGVVMNLDSASSPANFVIAYHAGANARLEKCVAGTYTSVIVAAATYAAGATLAVIKDGSDYSLYYNNQKIGSTSTISDAGIVDNTKHGLFSTYSGNTLDNFTVFPRGKDGEYAELDNY